MKLKIPARQPKCAVSRGPADARAIALVITLLMLSVITFLAIAFLSMTRRDRNAVTASLDVDTAHTMSDAAAARAQAEIIAQMMAHQDVLSYDYRVSRNFINPLGFNKTLPGYFTNVNYNNYYNANGGGSPFNWSGNAAGAKAWAQNIANLYYDPRPPVFIITNAAFPKASDFRYWVDINRNGRFEGSGYLPTYDNFGNVTYDSLGNIIASNYIGEPEWIGVLKYPQFPHSATNQFMGRYAYMVLPIGKTLDLNFIHNHAKSTPSMANDGFIRDQGVGSWELNLAALLNDLNINMYPISGPGSYFYSPVAATQNSGNAFVDANQFLSFRYQSSATAPHSLNFFFQPIINQFGQDGIDEYGSSPATVAPLDFTAATDPDKAGNAAKAWPGSYDTNLFYDVQDLFDPNKTGPLFQNRLTNWLAQPDSYNSYTFQRLLGSIGMSSSPEYGVYVYDDSGNQTYRTKVNINYDNSSQIQAGPYSPMPTNLTSWSPTNFFMNAAELLLRSQIFVFTNYVAGTVVTTPLTFGVTNIPIFAANNPGVRYNEQVHRMLQLAANIYDAANSTNLAGPNLPPVYHPTVFRPQFSLINPGTINAVLKITNYVQVLPGTAYNQLTLGFKDVTNTTIAANDNVWGIPWVVGAVTGNPQFDQVSDISRVLFNRQLLFVRQTNSQGQPDNTKRPLYTNQFYVMQISNTFGLDAWNPYSNNFSGVNGGVVSVLTSNYVTVLLTNNYNYGFTTNFIFAQVTNVTSAGPWPGWFGNPPRPPNPAVTTQFRSFVQTNFGVISPGYYSDLYNQYITYSTANNFSPLPTEMSQTHWPVHNWTLCVTNRVNYVLFDGPVNTGAVLDFVNLGPYGMSTNLPGTNGANGDQWLAAPATDNPNGSPMSAGVLNQIRDAAQADATFYDSINGIPPGLYGSTFGTGQNGIGVLPPYVLADFPYNLVAADPLVHYTVGDLIMPGGYSVTEPPLTYPLYKQAVPSSIGKVTSRYEAHSTSRYMGQIILEDPGVVTPTDWQFPTNKFPGIGWLGRVHRGTPWQTIYLKSDIAGGLASWGGWVNSPYTYPTNDWSLVDLFTANPNDNAARGLLSVNQTNTAAWSALFDGVIAMTNNTGGIAIAPNEGVYSPSNFMDATNIGINAFRANMTYNTNAIFHKLGDILQAPILTVQSPFVTNFIAEGGTPSDEMVERIPQQTLSLLKVGQPQFVIYAWGQSLKPKNLYSSPAIGFDPLLNNICTNYEITGEFLSRIVCHVVSDAAAAKPKFVIDSYNIEPGD